MVWNRYCSALNPCYFFTGYRAASILHPKGFNGAVNRDIEFLNSFLDSLSKVGYTDFLHC